MSEIIRKKLCPSSSDHRASGTKIKNLQHHTWCYRANEICGWRLAELARRYLRGCLMQDPRGLSGEARASSRCDTPQSSGARPDRRWCVRGFEGWT